MDQVRSQLRSLEAACVAPFEEVFAAYAQAVAREDALAAALHALEQQVLARNASRPARASHPSSPTRASAADDMARESAAAALRCAESGRRTLAAEVAARDEHLRRVASEARANEAALFEKDILVGVLRDELQALQLELLATDERLKAVETENRLLVQGVYAPPAVLAPTSAFSLGACVRAVFACSGDAGFSALAVSPGALHALLPDAAPRTFPIENASSAVALAGHVACVQAGNECTLAVWRTSAGGGVKPCGSAQRSGDPFVALAALHGTLVLGAHASGALCLYDVARGGVPRALWTESLPQNAPRALCALAGGRVAVLSDGRAGLSVSVWDTALRRLVGRLPPALLVGCAPSEIVLASAGAMLAVFRDGRAWVFGAGGSASAPGVGCVEQAWMREDAAFARPECAALSAAGVLAVGAGPSVGVCRWAADAPSVRLSVGGGSVVGLAFSESSLLVVQAGGAVSSYALSSF